VGTLCSFTLQALNDEHVPIQ